MKRLLILTAVFAGMFLPVIAQDISQVDEVPVEVLKADKSKIPQAVIDAANTLFKGQTQVAWGKFPYELKDYGWVVDKDYNEPIDHYEILIKANNGSEIYAVFESTGELIRSKTISKNAPVPAAIVNKIESGEYKGWKISGDVLSIKVNQKKVIEHYVVTIKKDNQTKTLLFAPDGTILKNKA